MKKVTLRDAKEDVDKIFIELQKLLTTQVENLYTCGFSLQHKTFSVLEPQLRNRFKELRVGSGIHSRKVELSSVKYFHAFVSTLNLVSPIGANSD